MDQFDASMRERIGKIIDEHLPRRDGYIEDVHEMGDGTDASLILNAVREREEYFLLWDPNYQNKNIDALLASIAGIHDVINSLPAHIAEAFLDSSEGGNSPIADLETVLQMLQGREPAARRVAELGRAPGGSDWTAAAVADACSGIFVDRTGKKAPRSVQHDEGANVPFKRFTQAIFKELGITLSVRRALELIQTV